MCIRDRFNTAYATLIVGFMFLVGSIQATQMLPTGFIPDEDTSRVVASVELPPGSTLEDTRVTTDKLVDVLKTIPEVRDVFVLGGASPTGQREVRRAAVFILLKPKAERCLLYTSMWRATSPNSASMSARVGRAPTQNSP